MNSVGLLTAYSTVKFLPAQCSDAASRNDILPTSVGFRTHLIYRSIVGRGDDFATVKHIGPFNRRWKIADQSRAGDECVAKVFCRDWRHLRSSALVVARSACASLPWFSQNFMVLALQAKLMQARANKGFA
jgi:hypothetical protein